MRASLANVRSMAVMKHNGANVCADMIMHFNFTGISRGMVLVSANDPGGYYIMNGFCVPAVYKQHGYRPLSLDGGNGGSAQKGGGQGIRNRGHSKSG